MVGRPRSEHCDRAILEAALGEYAANGLEALSVDAVAARAGVSKATIYRRYPSKVALVVASAFAIAEETAPRPDTGSLQGDVEAAVQNLRALLDDPVLGAAVRMLVVDATQNAELEQMHTDFVQERRSGTFAAFRRAIERGEMHADVDLDFAADALAAPLFYRHLVAHKPISDEYVEQVIETFMARFATVTEPATTRR